MRHALGILLGLVLAPVLLGVAGWGFFRATQVSGATLDPQSGEVLSGLAVLVAAGLVIGLLAAARWVPPSAALAAGLVFVGATAYYVLAIDSFTKELVKHGELGEGIFGLIRTGTAALVGVLLLVAAAMPHRWASRSAADDPAEADPMYAELPPYQSSGYAAGGTTAGYGTPDYSASGGTGGYSASGASSGYGQSGYSQSGYSQPGYSQSGYSQSDYTQAGSGQSAAGEAGSAQSGPGQSGYTRPDYSQSGYPPPGYSAGSGQHRAPDSRGSSYFDESSS